MFNHTVQLKMAPKVCVPADFGRHHIGAPSHGNLTFNLGEGVKIRANSIILSLNSPVIDELTTNLHQTSLEADDFSREAVDCFVECSYTGEIEAVNLGNFRDVNKMSRVFQVSWLVAKCEEYFESYLDKLDSESSYSDMLFVVEEAVYLMSAIKSRDFLNLTVEKIASISVTSRDSFVKRYLSNFGLASNHKISACIALVQTNVHVLLELLITHIKKSGNTSLDESSRHLLRNIDMSLCFDKKPEVHEELFTVLENLTDASKEDSLLFLSMYKQLSRRKPANNTITTLNTLNTTLLPVIHLGSFKSYLCRSKNFSKIFSEMSAREDIADLYTIVDGLWLRLYNISESVSPFTQKMVDLVEQRGWSPICAEYVKGLQSDSHTGIFLETVLSSDKLIREYDGSPYVTIFEYSQPEFINKIFCSDNIFKFQIPGDLYANQEFVLSTTAVKDGNSNSFDLRWGPSKYCSALPDLPKVHFALLLKSDKKSWNRVLPLSWCGKPTCDVSRTHWNWGYISFHIKTRDERRKMFRHSDWFVGWPYCYEILQSEVIKMAAFLIQ